MATKRTTVRYDTQGDDKVKRVAREIEESEAKAHRTAAGAAREHAQAEAGLDAELAKLDAELDQFEAGLGDTTQALTTTGTKAGVVAGAIIGVGTGAVLAARQLNQFTVESLESVAELQKQADAIGVSVARLQELEFASIAAGVSQNELAGATGSLRDVYFEAQAGQGDLLDALREYSPELATAIGESESFEEALDRVLKNLSATTSETELGAKAAVLFGDNWKTVVPIVRDGGKAFDTAQKSSHTFFNEIEAFEAEEAAREIARVNQEIENLGDKAGISAGKAAVAFAKIEASWASLKNAIGAGIFNLFLGEESELTRVNRLETSLEGQRRTLRRLRQQEAEGEGDPQVLRRRIEHMEQVVQRTKDRIKAKRELIGEIKNEAQERRKANEEAEAGARKILEGLQDEQDETEKTTKKISEKERAHKRAITAIEKLEERAALAGLEGVDLIMEKRDMALEHQQGLLEQGVIDAEEFARARVAIEKIAQEDIADEREKAREKDRREKEREAKRQERDLQREADRQARILAQPVLNAIDGIQTSFRDGIRDMLDGSLDSFSDFGDAMLDVFLDMIAEMAALAIARPILVPILQGGGGAGAGAGIPGVQGGGGGILDTTLNLLNNTVGGLGQGILDLGSAIIGLPSSIGSAITSLQVPAGLVVAPDVAVGGGFVSASTPGATTAVGGSGIAGGGGALGALSSVGFASLYALAAISALEGISSIVAAGQARKGFFDTDDSYNFGRKSAGTINSLFSFLPFRSLGESTRNILEGGNPFNGGASHLDIAKSGILAFWTLGLGNALVSAATPPTAGTALRKNFEEFIEGDRESLLPNIFRRGSGQKATRRRVEETGEDFETAMRNIIDEEFELLGLDRRHQQAFTGLGVAFRSFAGSKAGHEYVRSIAPIADLLISMRQEAFSAGQAITLVQEAIDELGGPPQVFSALFEFFLSEDNDIRIEDMTDAIEGLAFAMFDDLPLGAKAAEIALDEFHSKGTIVFEDLQQRVADVAAGAQLLAEGFGPAIQAGIANPSLTDSEGFEVFENRVKEAMANALSEGLLQAALEGNFSALFFEDFGRVSRETFEQVAAGDLPLTDAIAIIKQLGIDSVASLEEMRPLVKELIHAGRELGEIFTDINNATGELTEGFNQGIADQILGLTDPNSLQIRQLESLQEQRIRNAIEVEGDILQVEQLNALERQQVAERLAEAQIGEAESVLRQIGSLRQDLLAGPLSPLGPVATLPPALERFMALDRGVREGDLDAARELPDAARDLLDIARQVHGSTESFFDIFHMVTDALGRAEGRNPALFITPGEEQITTEIRAASDHLDETLLKILDEQIEANDVDAKLVAFLTERGLLPEGVRGRTPDHGQGGIVTFEDLEPRKVTIVDEGEVRTSDATVADSVIMTGEKSHDLLRQIGTDIAEGNDRLEQRLESLEAGQIRNTNVLISLRGDLQIVGARR